MPGQRKNNRNNNRRTATSRSRSNSRTRSNKANNGKFFPGLFIGFILGIIATSVLDVSSLNKLTEPLTAEQPKADKQPDQPQKPRFDFYTLLQESEVIVSENETPVLNEQIELPEKKPVAATPKSSEVYLLQVGSFKSAGDADSLRVNLLLLNLQAYIEKVHPKPGETWHRVLVGPLDSRSQVANAKSKLAANKIDSLLLKRKR